MGILHALSTHLLRIRRTRGSWAFASAYSPRFFLDEGFLQPQNGFYEQFNCYFQCNFIHFLQNRFKAILQFSATLRVHGRHFNCGEGLSPDTVTLFQLSRV